MNTTMAFQSIWVIPYIIFKSVHNYPIMLSLKPWFVFLNFLQTLCGIEITVVVMMESPSRTIHHGFSSIIETWFHINIFYLWYRNHCCCHDVNLFKEPFIVVLVGIIETWFHVNISCCEYVISHCRDTIILLLLSLQWWALYFQFAYKKNWHLSSTYENTGHHEVLFSYDD